MYIEDRYTVFAEKYNARSRDYWYHSQLFYKGKKGTEENLSTTHIGRKIQQGNDKVETCTEEQRRNKLLIAILGDSCYFRCTG